MKKSKTQRIEAEGDRTCCVCGGVFIGHRYCDCRPDPFCSACFSEHYATCEVEYDGEPDASEDGLVDD